MKLSEWLRNTNFSEISDKHQLKQFSEWLKSLGNSHSLEIQKIKKQLDLNPHYIQMVRDEKAVREFLYPNNFFISPGIKCHFVDPDTKRLREEKRQQEKQKEIAEMFKQNQLSQLKIAMLMAFISNNYHLFTIEQKVESLNEVGYRYEASGNLFENENGKVVYTKNALETDFQATTKAEVGNINSTNAVQKAEAFERTKDWNKVDYHNPENVIHLLNTLQEVKDKGDRKRLLTQITPEKLNIIQTTAQQYSELKPIYDQFIQSYKGQISVEQQEKLISLNQDIRKEHERIAINNKLNTLRGF